MKSSSYYLTRTGYKSFSNTIFKPSDSIITGIEFKLIFDNNYDIENKRLTNVADREDHKGIVNKEFID